MNSFTSESCLFYTSCCTGFEMRNILIVVMFLYSDLSDDANVYYTTFIVPKNYSANKDFSSYFMYRKLYEVIVVVYDAILIRRFQVKSRASYDGTYKKYS